MRYRRAAAPGGVHDRLLGLPDLRGLSVANLYFMILPGLFGNSAREGMPFDRELCPRALYDGVLGFLS